ncbi:MAG TPA: adenylate/guanylate cyclase domain-containing protein [Alphaproteobacteria bacterium]|nr:adenylate/guanylate cyclase domain-containing protein [Alphaproteobacteria bacterium]
MSAPGPVILIVDDNEMNRYTLARRLRREGYGDIVEAEDGRVALDHLARRRFDLVLLDVMMPVMNGFEVLGRLKADATLRDIPVIMISAVDELESVVRCIELGAEDYLPKPFNATLLRARLGACLEKKRLADQEALYRQWLDAERRRADNLLSAILPEEVARELKEAGAVRPRRHDGVTVLFCDVVDFTPYCDRHAPEEVMADLQALVHALEEIVGRRGMEKIKTIGDAFMATAGLLGPLSDPVMTAVACGFEMIEATKATKPDWRVRVGLHHGPVIAGIIGRRQFLYDLWGDTVNTAARITAWAPPDSVVLSAEAWAHVRGRCTGRSHGAVALKGKGWIELVECRGLLHPSPETREREGPSPLELGG